jgi:hypothetical protein
LLALRLQQLLLLLLRSCFVGGMHCGAAHVPRTCGLVEGAPPL